MRKRYPSSRFAQAGPSLAAFVFLLSLIARLVYYSDLIHFPLATTLILDAERYDIWAKEILAGDLLGANKGLFALNPAYAYLLAGVYGVLGRSVEYVLLVQFVVGSLNCVLVFFIALEIFDNKRAASVAAALLAFYGYSVFIEGLVLTAVWIVFFNSAALYSFLIGVRYQRGYLIFLASLFIGISGMFRANNFLLIFVFLVWLVLREKNSKKR